jgi:hypothetical protein
MRDDFFIPLSGDTPPSRCKCGAPAAPLGKCPYKSDIHGDDETLCNCCYDCRLACADEI